jgi:hypothetical protein
MAHFKIIATRAVQALLVLVLYLSLESFEQLY